MNYKLRLKHPSGAEFEAEGPAEFILSEKEGFLKAIENGKARPAGAAAQPAGAQPTAWSELAEVKNGLTILKTKYPELKAPEAALIILAADRQLKGSQSTSALELSRAVKASGYMPDRLDRTLAGALREGLLKASGTKRNRAYRLTEKGLEKAGLTTHNLLKQG